MFKRSAILRFGVRQRSLKWRAIAMRGNLDTEPDHAAYPLDHPRPLKSNQTGKNSSVAVDATSGESYCQRSLEAVRLQPSHAFHQVRLRCVD